MDELDKLAAQIFAHARAMKIASGTTGARDKIDAEAAYTAAEVFMAFARSRNLGG